MKWYIAHIIAYYEPIEGFKSDQGVKIKIHVQENMYLIKSLTLEQAWEKAEKIGKKSQILDTESPFSTEEGDFLYRFGGVRKIINCLPDDERPKDETEVSYNEYEVNKKDLQKLIDGKEVKIKYLE